MYTYIWAYLGTAGLAVVLTPFVIWLARRIGAVDRPTIRSIHTQPIPLHDGDPWVVREFEIGLAVNGSYETLARRATLFGRLLDEKPAGQGAGRSPIAGGGFQWGVPAEDLVRRPTSEIQVRSA